jgi:hypothetical protein
MKKLILATLLMLAIGMAFAAAGTTGVITYLEGTVSISRSGQFIPKAKVSSGLQIQEMDVVETGKDGYLEIEIRSDDTANGTIVRVKENTSYYFKVSQEGKKKKTVFQMLTGTLGFKVKKLGGDDSVDVKSGSTTMGVRGTEFYVSSVPDGSILVTCNEGKVACIWENKEEYAYPGQVCEKLPGEPVNRLAIEPQDLETFRTNWMGNRIQALSGNLAASLAFYTGQYDQYWPRFQKAHKKITEKKALLKKWDDLMQKGKTTSMGDAKKDEIELSAPMMEFRAILPMFEETFYTLDALVALYRDGYGGKDTAAKTQKKVKEFESGRENARKMLTEARYWYRVYLYIKDSSMAGFPNGDSTTPSGLLDGESLF